MKIGGIIVEQNQLINEYENRKIEKGDKVF